MLNLVLHCLFQFVQRGGQLIKKWGRSSAASTAVSIADAMKSLLTLTPEGDWFSSGVWSEGNPYGIAQDLVFSMPCRSQVRCLGQAAHFSEISISFRFETAL